MSIVLDQSYTQNAICTKQRQEKNTLKQLFKRLIVNSCHGSHS